MYLDLVYLLQVLEIIFKFKISENVLLLNIAGHHLLLSIIQQPNPAIILLALVSI